MSDRTIDRRAFLESGTRTCVTLCGICLGAQLPALASLAADEEPAKRPEPKKLSYCGYSCPKECTFLRATLANDVELKRQAWTEWKIEQRFGVAFDPERAICHGCKALDKPQGIVLARCDVRACVQEKKLDCCIECATLDSCDKDLWRRFPDFKQHVLTMRQQYLAT